MHVFVTGATGWLGSAIVEDLIAAGHRVTGLSRTSEKAHLLAAAGAQVLRATFDDIGALQAAAAAADAVIHTAFNHDFSNFPASCEQDRHVIAALGSVLEGSRRPLLVTSGLFGVQKGGTEHDLPASTSPRKSEAAARTLAERGVRAATVRLAPSVHGLGDHGFVPLLVRLARQTGVSAYLGDGQNCWSGVHRTDAARLYRHVLEQGVDEPAYHAVADERVPFKMLAEMIGKHLGLPVEPRDREHFGWFAMMAGADMSVSSTRTRVLLGWMPRGPSLLDDLDQAAYYTV